MVRGAENEATQKIATAGSCYYPGTGRAVRTGGVTRLQKSWQTHSCWIITEGLWSGVGAQRNQLRPEPPKVQEGVIPWFLPPIA